MLKRFLAIIMLITLVMGNNVSVLASDIQLNENNKVEKPNVEIVAKSQKAGDEYAYEYQDNGDGTVTITKYTGTDTNVVVPSAIAGKKVVSVAYLAFCENNAIESITFSEGLQYLSGESVFECGKLEWISLPNSYASKNGSFKGLGGFCVGCPNLKEFRVKSNHPNLKVVDGN